MKKLIAILLVLACMFALAACGGGSSNTPVTPLTPPAANETQDILDALADLIKTSVPTQSKVNTVTGTADVNLKSETVITMGEISGKEAALYVHEEEVFNDLGALEAKSLVVETMEFVDGMGLRVNAAKGGAWEPDGASFVRRIMPYRMELDATMIKSLLVNESRTEFSFVIPQENASDVLTGIDSKTIASMLSDISVTIKTDGTAVTYMELNYTTKSAPHFENPTIKVVAEYSYDLQSITLLG